MSIGLGHQCMVIYYLQVRKIVYRFQLDWEFIDGNWPISSWES